jgi:xylulokinase
MPLYLGLDVGTQGARALVCDESGRVVSQASEPFQSPGIPDLPAGWFEQDPQDWWKAAVTCLKKVAAGLSEGISALSVDSTSGTILPVDENGNPLTNALMYNDGRAVDEAKICNEAGIDLTEKLGYKFGASFALPKILWIKNHQPDVYQRTWKFIHAADFIIGRLIDDFGISDYSNALKTGYDLVDLKWPDFIEYKLDIPLSKLPVVVTPGEIIGSINPSAGDETELKTGTPVAAGVSDGTAGFIASGASGIGDWNSTIGTTLVLRGVSKNLVKDPQGRIYCHRHPDGWWLPGGASNVGGECLAKFFPNDDYAELDRQASQYLPTDVIVYPLARQGERLPFINNNAQGFVSGEPRNRAELYAAYLQGVAFVERWSLELMEELGADVSGTVYATGGGAKSLQWMQIRADVLGRKIVRPAITESAMGSAIVAASRTGFNCLSDASSAMVSIDAEVRPDSQKAQAYNERYKRFREECKSHSL